MTSQLTSVLSPPSVEPVRVVALKMLVAVVTCVVGVMGPHGNVQLGEGFHHVGEGKVLVAMETYGVANDG